MSTRVAMCSYCTTEEVHPHLSTRCVVVTRRVMMFACLLMIMIQED